MRNRFSCSISDIPLFKQKLLLWLKGFDTFSYLDNNNYHDYQYSNYELLVAVEKKHFIECSAGNAFNELEQFLIENKDWAFGHFNYDLKNEIEKLHSSNPDHLRFSDLFFFIPEHIIYIKSGSNEVVIESAEPEQLYNAINNVAEFETHVSENINIQSRFPKDDYLKTVEKIREHIAEGDFYEMNLCMEFFAENVSVNPFHVFEKLNEINRAPFTTFFRNKNQYLICSSPERFMMKQGRKLVSQPIKGTIRKSDNKEENDLLKSQLQNDVKERAENVMIVDLVRNDLAKSCKAGSIKVEELFGIYSFKQVNQMISTITGELREDTSAIEAIKNAFPMGSMTGAPKVIVMEHIEKYEQSKRGLYSGAFGYFTPDMDFDFNVVIRSILYNAEQKYLSFQTGSAITFDSVPEKEYEECLIKARAMQQAIEG
jgi:para-aminobenzoate synthetase component I